MPPDPSTELELYKVAVEMADRTSARRAGANSFFVTLNAALAALVGILSAAREVSPHGAVPSFDAFGLSVAAVAGVVLSLTWWALLRYYRRLNRAKFQVIIAMEEGLPARPYTMEWTHLHAAEQSSDTGSARRGVRGWWRRNHHREASVVEQVVPFVFATIYLLLIVRILWFR